MLDVVICGNIRSELAFYEIVREAVQARAAGLVKQIVFSTWRSERAAFPELFSQLGRVGVDVVLLDHPGPQAGSLFIQHLQFWRGLQALKGADGWVLKTRTEKAFLNTANLFAAMREGRFTLDQIGGGGPVFERQVVVSALSLNEPFAHDDIVILARRADALRMLNLDGAFDQIFNDTGYFPQEARWFATPIMARFPELKPLFQSVNVHRLTAAIRRAGAQGTLAEAPDAVMQYLAAIWSISHALFALPELHDFGQAPPLADFLALRAERPFAVNWGNRLMATSGRWWETLAQGDGGEDPAVARIAAHRTPPERFGEAIGALHLQGLQAFATSAPFPPAPPARFDVLAAVQARNDTRGLFGTLFPGLAPDSLGSLFDGVEADIDEERRTGALNAKVLARGQTLAAEARSTRDPVKAQAAFTLALSGAWARLAEAVDLACALAFEGLVGEAERRRAFETVYTIHIGEPGSPVGHFWFGVGHIYGLYGEPRQAHGLELVQRAADLGMERAKSFLADWPGGSALPGYPV